MAEYELFLCNDRGRRLMPLTNLSTFSASKLLNGLGAFSAVLRPPSDLATLQNYHYIERNIRPDWQVQVWQKTRGPMQLWRPYFVLNWGWTQGEDGEETFSFGGYDVNHLLTRRVVAAYAESTQAKMSDYADDMMKAVVTDSLEDDAAPTPTAGQTRAWADLTVQADVSKGPSIDLAFAWRQVLTPAGGGVLSQIANAARENGTEVLFWIVQKAVSTAGVTYQFNTAVNQWRDLTTGNNLVVFDADAGTLVDWALTYDYSEEVNAVYALGQGDETNRNVQQVADAARYQRSYWGRCEGVAEARMMETDAAVQDAGYDALCEGRPRIKLSGTPVSRQGQEFGRHYRAGDRVVARAKGKQFGALVWSEVVSMDEDGKVSETSRLEYR